jgi:hypothetical protein
MGIGGRPGRLFLRMTWTAPQPLHKNTTGLIAQITPYSEFAMHTIIFQIQKHTFSFTMKTG